MVTGEASTRLPGPADPAGIATRLRDRGWHVEVREIGDGDVRLVGAGRVEGTAVGLDIGVWATPDVVTVRTLVAGVHVGVERAAGLVASGER